MYTAIGQPDSNFASNAVPINGAGPPSIGAASNAQHRAFMSATSKPSPAMALRYAIKISPKTAIKNNNDDGQKVTSSGA
jgi:hypothetical protein